MKTVDHFLIGAELLSLLALFMVFFKVIVLKPACFSLFDNYFTILPLFTAKILELYKLNFNKKYTKNFQRN